MNSGDGQGLQEYLVSLLQERHGLTTEDAERKVAAWMQSASPEGTQPQDLMHQESAD